MDAENTAEGFAELLKILANPLRLKILALCLSNERTSRELREELGISKPLLISHLRKLVNTGLLEFRAELDTEKMIVRKYYRTKNFEICINPEVLKEISEELKSKKSLTRTTTKD